MLVYRQDELSVLERDLIKLDADDEKKRDFALKSRKWDEETDEDPVYSRKVLIQKIDDKLKEYGQHVFLIHHVSISSLLPSDGLVSRIKTYLSLKAPSSRNTKTFIDWIDDHKPLSPEESAFIQHKDDFVALSDGQESGWLDGIVEDGLSWCLPAKLMKVQHLLSPSTCFAARIVMSKASDTRLLEVFYVRRAGQKDRRRSFAPVQQAPHRCSSTPCPCPYHCRFIDRTFRGSILCHRTERVEDLSYNGVFASFRYGT